MTKIDITPFQIVYTHNVTKLSINRIEIDLDTSITLSYTFYTDAGIPVKSGNLIISGDDYTNWKNGNDTFLVTKIMDAQ
jgi:hypothetical protein